MEGEAMNTSKFTAGPWEVTEGLLECGAEAAVWGPDGDCVAFVWGNLALDGDPIKTARLIAAAPEMYEALCAAEGALYPCSTKQARRSALGHVRAALAKAKG